MDIMSFIPEQLFLLVAALNVLGFVGKSYPRLDNRYIPIALLLFGVVFSVLMQGISTEAVLQGILCWGVAIGVNQTYKQFKQ